MSKQSYDHTELVGLCRVVEEAGPLSAAAMVGDFIELTKRGLLTGQGYLSTKGKELLAREDDKP